MLHLFKDHPASVGETYLEHMRQAASFGAEMVTSGLACLVHALLPFAFIDTGSRSITRLYERMVTGRIRRTGVRPAKNPLSPNRGPQPEFHI